MRKALFAGIMACSSLTAFAHQCDVELQGNMQLENKVLAVTLDNDTRITIDQDKALFVDGEMLSLNSHQQGWVNSYYDGINEAAPQAARIATDAVALASTALNEVFTELLGSNNHALEELSEKLINLDQQIQYNFYSDNGEIRLDSDMFENGEFFGEQWEAQFEESIESLVTESIGHLMVAIGSQIIFSGGDMDAFEQKMERFGEQIEEKVEYQATALEDKADALCSTLANVDFAETQLQSIPQLADLDIIHMQDQSNRM